MGDRRPDTAENADYNNYDMTEPYWIGLLMHEEIKSRITSNFGCTRVRASWEKILYNVADDGETFNHYPLDGVKFFSPDGHYAWPTIRHPTLVDNILASIDAVFRAETDESIQNILDNILRGFNTSHVSAREVLASLARYNNNLLSHASCSSAYDLYIAEQVSGRDTSLCIRMIFGRDATSGSPDAIGGILNDLKKLNYHDPMPDLMSCVRAVLDQTRDLFGEHKLWTERGPWYDYPAISTDPRVDDFVREMRAVYEWVIEQNIISPETIPCITQWLSPRADETIEL